MKRKLSDILIEIAMQGLKSPKYCHSEVMYPMMFLSQATIKYTSNLILTQYMVNYEVAFGKKMKFLSFLLFL